MTHSGTVTEALQFKLLPTIMLNSGGACKGGTPHCYNLENMQKPTYICTIYCIYTTCYHSSLQLVNSGELSMVLKPCHYPAKQKSKFIIYYKILSALHLIAHSCCPLNQFFSLFELHLSFIINSCTGFNPKTFEYEGNDSEMLTHHGHELRCTFTSFSFADLSQAIQFYSHLLQFELPQHNSQA